MNIPIAENGYLPTWGTMDATVFDHTFSVRVGFYTVGWNLNFHQDQNIELTHPPFISHTTYTVSTYSYICLFNSLLLFIVI